MAFTSPSEPILVQEGTLGFDYDASGSVYAGQGVYAVTPFKVKAPGTGIKNQAGCVGVAAYDASDGKPVMVYGPGNIVKVIVSGASKCTAGDLLCLVDEGKFANTGVTPSGGVHALALETQASADGTARVLLI